MRTLKTYVAKYGPETGRKLYHALQSQAAHAGVSARLRRKIRELTGLQPPSPRRRPSPMPLFPDEPRSEAVLDAANS